MTFRTGFGHDIHRTQPGRRLVLGGLEIPCEFGLAGHSDADVVIHALCDALLGAAGLGDIGELFPDTDAAFKDADSKRFLIEVMKRVGDLGYEPVNADLMILAERPKLAPHKPAMRQVLADLLGLPIDAVNVKAGTNEKLDAVGRGEAIACMAVVLIRRAGPADGSGRTLAY